MQRTATLLGGDGPRRGPVQRSGFLIFADGAWYGDGAGDGGGDQSGDGGPLDGADGAGAGDAFCEAAGAGAGAGAGRPTAAVVRPAAVGRQ